MIVYQTSFYTPAKQIRPLHIHLPDNYYETDERYPVMYFFDGHNLFEDSKATYGKSWGLETFMNAWDKPMIIVGIECGHAENERLSEYLPYPAAFGMFARFEPRGEETLSWLVEELKPMIDSRYRTMPFRECTGIGGSSMGGLMSLYGIVRYNNWFSKGACISSAIGFCMTPLLADLSSCTISPDTHAFLSWGTKEAGLEDVWQEDQSSNAYRCNKSVEKKLLEHDALPKLYCQVGGAHCEADWEKQVPLFMDFLWK